MLTPEVQQFITQSRTAGMSDADIRQKLSAQGWSAGDLDQAFGTTTAGASTPPQKSNSGKIIAIILILLLLFGAAWGWFAFHTVKQITDKYNPANFVNNNNANNSNNLTKTPVCNQLPSPYTQTKPNNFPADVPIYNGAQFIGALQQGMQSVVYYCSPDNLDSVKAFYLSDHGTWTVKDSQSFSDSESLVLANSTNDQVVLNISKNGQSNGSTLIIYTFTAK